VDVHYKKLKTDMLPVDPSSEEFKMVEVCIAHARLSICPLRQTYTRNTHAATHTQYKLVIEELFRIDRHGERDKYKPFSSLHNRMLLWHGFALS
jgi:poly [ADP-ribose] polymerase